MIQPGARLHYAVPAILARAGVLNNLYTDLHADHSWLEIFDRVWPSTLKSKAMQRLLGRRLPEGLSPRLVKDRPAETILRTMAEYLGVGTANDAISRRLLSDLEAAPLGEGDTVYTVLVNEDISTMRRLKERGVRIVHECMLSPNVAAILAEEYLRFPHLCDRPDMERDAQGTERDREKYELSDLVIAPSDFVARAVHEIVGTGDKIARVPYGLDLTHVANELCRPVTGRVLSVGSVGIRKGHHYLAAAARLLSRSGIDVHVVGPASPDIIGKSELSGPNYHGQIPRSELFAYYRQADVFVLPSLCEGMALVHLEALAHGIPVVTTPNCGSVVRDGKDGFIVPIRDPETLADRVELIVSNRSLREEMSCNARQRAQEYSLEAYGKRLLAALKEH